jgi:hypothetical protein
MRFWHVVYLGLVLLFVAAGPAAAQSNPASSASPASSAKASTDSQRTATPSASASAATAAKAESGTQGKPDAESKAGVSGASTPPAVATAGASRSPNSDANIAVDGATYMVRLRDLEQRVDELKEQIRRSHTRLSLLSDSILAGGVGGARAEITFINDMSNVFQLTRALFLLDGAVQNNKQDETGALAEQKEIPVFSGSIPPGDHTLQVLVQLRGHGFGVFSYLQGYRFEIRSSHSFTVTEGKTVELRAIAYEKGGVTVPLEQRPAMRYFERVRANVQGEKGPAAAGTTDKASKGGASAGAGSE